MLSARTRALRTARPLQREAQRRWESLKGHHTEHQTTPGDPHPVEHGNVNESLGSKFFITLAALPIGYFIYDSTTSDAEHPSWLTRHIGSYDSWNRDWEKRNDQHSRLIQQAALDRNIFGSAEPTRMVDLRFPEQFNSGSPYNNVAGQRVDLSEVISHYQKRNKETEEKIQNKTDEQRKII